MCDSSLLDLFLLTQASGINFKWKYPIPADSVDVFYCFSYRHRLSHDEAKL